MTRECEDILDAMWRLAAFDTDVEASVLLYSALIGVYHPDFNWTREARSFLVMTFFLSCRDIW